MKSFKILFSILLMIVFVRITAQTDWQLDTSHTKLGFSVTHMVVSETEGDFKDFSGKVVTIGDNFENAEIELKAKIASIDTDNKDRDDHLRSPDFFNAGKYPEMNFKSKSMKKVSDVKYKLVGDLTIKNVTKEVELDVKFNGVVNDPFGFRRAGFKVTGELNRFDYGLEWNNLLDTGGLMVGKEVLLSINIELVRKV